MSSKADDTLAVPLCPQHHRELHAFGDEGLWWAMLGVDPLMWIARRFPPSE